MDRRRFLLNAAAGAVGAVSPCRDWVPVLAGQGVWASCSFEKLEGAPATRACARCATACCRSAPVPEIDGCRKQSSIPKYKNR